MSKNYTANCREYVADSKPRNAARPTVAAGDLPTQKNKSNAEHAISSTRRCATDRSNAPKNARSAEAIQDSTPAVDPSSEPDTWTTNAHSRISNGNARSAGAKGDGCRRILWHNSCSARRGYDDAHRPARATAATKHGERAPTTGPLAGLRMPSYLKPSSLYNHETQIRTDRINRLTTLLADLIPNARNETISTGWYSRHVVWTIQRLEHLGYPFPEVDITIEPHAAWNDRMRAAA